MIYLLLNIIACEVISHSYIVVANVLSINLFLFCLCVCICIWRKIIIYKFGLLESWCWAVLISSVPYKARVSLPKHKANIKDRRKLGNKYIKVVLFSLHVSPVFKDTRHSERALTKCNKTMSTNRNVIFFMLLIQRNTIISPNTYYNKYIRISNRKNSSTKWFVRNIVFSTKYTSEEKSQKSIF